MPGLSIDSAAFVDSAPSMPVDSLTGPRIQLRPLQASDAEALVAASCDGELWNLPYTVVPSTETVEAYVRVALEGRAAGTVMPFVIVVRETDRVIGSTRFWKIDRKDRKLEIGSTWLAASWQRTFANTEVKYLMLRAAFEEMACVRVQFTTDETNATSRAAILRLGAKEEGVIRHERIMPNGRKRNSVRYSIIDDEWPSVKATLEARLHR
jgi:RimJ/RimL family protein N-acetyltransferase